MNTLRPPQSNSVLGGVDEADRGKDSELRGLRGAVGAVKAPATDNLALAEVDMRHPRFGEVSPACPGTKTDVTNVAACCDFACLRVDIPPVTGKAGQAFWCWLQAAT